MLTTDTRGRTKSPSPLQNSHDDRPGMKRPRAHPACDLCYSLSWQTVARDIFHWHELL